MNDRLYIEKDDSILLYGESNGEMFPRTFTVTGRNSNGASVLCYSAQYDKSGTGVLKEFYPSSVQEISRNEHNYLVFGSHSEKEKFETFLDEYLKPYNMLAELRRNEELASFIPAFEIYYDSPDKKGTVYIWSPEPRAETFDSYCRTVHADIADRPERRLLDILYAVESLTKCICSFHRFNLIHGDIKPANFGFIRRGKDAVMQAVTLFDLDTVSYIYNVPCNPRCTEGFCEPEIYNMKMNNQSDIYSIGATLFYAIINSTYIYYKGINFSGNIKNLVNTSGLIEALPENSGKDIKNILSEILCKALCRREERYHSCEEMLVDIKKALDYLVPVEITGNAGSSAKWILADTDKPGDKKSEKNITTALQYHLYTKPLYMNVPSGTENISLLIIGFGRYGQKFLDIALQTAQIPGKTLNVTVVSDSAEDKAGYLRERPALADFFNINGSQEGADDAYGNITFIVHEISRNFINSLPASDYVFIAVGNDLKNVSTAEWLKYSCPVSVALENSRVAVPDNILPIRINEDISQLPLYKEIERMAFNVHIIWKKDLNIDLAKLRKEYRTSYYHDSCVSFVISIKYKLHGIGIEFDSSPDETAKEYIRYITKDKKKKNELVFLEHRRWVTEKLCLGYTRITNLEECITGKTRDDRKKRHICIVKSRPEQVLDSKPWVKGSPDKPDVEKWDNPSIEELEKLDELERMSVDLHLMYKKHSEKVINENIFNGGIVSAIRASIEKEHGLKVSFQELITCMKDIRNCDIKQVPRYNGLKKSFLDNVKNSQAIDNQIKRSVSQLIDSLHNIFYPILASQQYRNYKKDDIDLVEGLPFILTYSSEIKMIIPYATGDNDSLFSNLSAPTVINPCKIIYFTFCENTQEMKNIMDSLPYMANYMKKRCFRAGVEFIIGYNPGKKQLDKKILSEDFRKLSSERVKKVTFIEAERPKQYICMLKDYLLKTAKKPDFLLEFNYTYLSGLAEGINMDKLFPSYTFNSDTMRFKAIHNCDLVKYIKFKPYITVSDMFSLKMSTSTTSNNPEFYEDYQELWDKYQSNTGVWKFLCRLFKEYSETNDIIAKFRRKNSKKPAEYTYPIPFSCRKTVESLIEALISQEIISDDSHIEADSTNSCQVKIHSLYDSKKDFDGLFSRPDILTQSEAVECREDLKNHIIRVVYNNLCVSKLDCSTLQNNGYKLLEYFYDKHYLINLDIDTTDKKASFTYATSQIKDLLTSEGRILEIFTYHKARATGQFDDIRAGFEIDWEKVNAKNEFDCILTKGFSTLFMECKATKEMKWEYYTKIESLSRHFGINVKIVIVADTQDTADSKAFNETYYDRGRQINVITISESDDIKNIGNVLLNLMG